MDANDLGYLLGRIQAGAAVLFTGAGFSRSALNSEGEPLPGVADLKKALWEIAFPGTEVDLEARLQDVFEAASAIAGNTTRDLLQRKLSVRRGGVPDEYRVWFSFPWARLYTLNIDNLDEKVGAEHHLPRLVESVSALTDEPPTGAGTFLQSIHLNGRVAEYPEVTFSDRQYGERTSSPDPWYRMLTNDLASRCVIFVGTTLDEPPLWQALELRQLRQGGQRELRPRSFLVTPELSLPRQSVLERYNIKWIPGSREQFVEEVLPLLQEAATAGIAAIAARADSAKQEGHVQPIASLRTDVTEDPREFLLGREPEWADVSDGGYAIVRDFESDLLNEFVEGSSRVLLLTGTAGSGKSTTLKRLSLQADTAGLKTIWLPSETDLPLPRLRNEVGGSHADIVAIDDLDAFGSAAGTFMQGLLNDNRHLSIIGAVRGSRYRRLRLDSELEQETMQVEVPLLADGDIDLLLDSLTAAHRLGRLRGMERTKQAKIFRDLAGRELLVAMIEATTGERFEDKIAQECDDLDSGAALLYSVFALASTFRHGLAQDEALDCAGGEPNIALNDFRYLLDHHLVIQRGSLFRVRHRYIAQRSVDHFQAIGQLAEPIETLAWVMATRVTTETRRHARERELLVAVLNHEFLIRRGLSQSQARAVYSLTEDLLAWDYHYWLQRGAYEVEHGDIHHAKNYLDQARSLASDDFMVRTEWAYMTIKRAALDPEAESAQGAVDEAIDELEDAIRMRGAVDQYPYHVLGSQGLSWARRAPMDIQVRRQFLAHLLGVVREGTHLHPQSPELQNLARDIEHDYLLTATIEEGEGN